jgi:GNAT superfamily N-acetyltransferase
MTKIASECTVRPMTPADEPAVLELLQASLAGGPTGVRTPEFFRWKHRDNPFGSSPALVAELDGRIVGLRIFLRWRFRAGQRLVSAVRAVDTATHPDYQGRGVFKALTTAAFDSLDDDVAMVFNTPNSNSLPGYLKMGWSLTGHVPIAIRPLRPVRLARHVLAARRRVPVTGVALPFCPLPTAGDVLTDSEGLDALVGEATALDDQRLATDRSLAYLRWRYADAPALGYRAVACERSGRLVGLAIGRPRWRGPLAEFTLSELVFRPGDRRTVRELLRSVAGAKTDHIATHFPPDTDQSACALRSGYLTPPRGGLLLVARPRRPVDPDPSQLSSWRFSLGDLEVF